MKVVFVIVLGLSVIVGNCVCYCGGCFFVGVVSVIV